MDTRWLPWVSSGCSYRTMLRPLNYISNYSALKEGGYCFTSSSLPHPLHAPPAPTHTTQMLGRTPAVPLPPIPTVIDPPPYLDLAVPRPSPKHQTPTSHPLPLQAICTKSSSPLPPLTHPPNTTSTRPLTYAPPTTTVPPTTSRPAFTRSHTCTGTRNPSMRLGSLLPRRIPGRSLSRDNRRGERGGLFH